jgi:hypothetical protein
VDPHMRFDTQTGRTEKRKRNGDSLNRVEIISGAFNNVF